jgi:hypothetical protein
VAEGDMATALTLYRRAWELGMRQDAALCNAACAASLAGQTAEALTWLERAAQAGFAHAVHLQQDADLAAVRAEAGFPRVVAQVEANEAKLYTASEPVLRDELLRMLAEDQAARAEVERHDFADDAANARLKAVDEKNTARLKALVTESGWPTRTRVGARAAQAAWLLALHADHDVAFQKHSLTLLEQAVTQGEAEPKGLAYLTDRVLLAEGKPQRYGTQFHRPQGSLVPRPMEAPAQVDARRAQMGLGTLAEQTSQLEQLSTYTQ